MNALRFARDALSPLTGKEFCELVGMPRRTYQRWYKYGIPRQPNETARRHIRTLKNLARQIQLKGAVSIMQNMSFLHTGRPLLCRIIDGDRCKNYHTYGHQYCIVHKWEIRAGKSYNTIDGEIFGWPVKAQKWEIYNLRYCAAISVDGLRCDAIISKPNYLCRFHLDYIKLGGKLLLEGAKGVELVDKITYQAIKYWDFKGKEIPEYYAPKVGLRTRQGIGASVSDSQMAEEENK